MGPEMMQTVPRPGRALRHALHHRPGDEGRARRRARRRPQGLGRRRRVPGAHRRSSRWAPSTRSSACPARSELGGRGVSLLRHLRRRVLQGPARRSSSAAATPRWRRRSSSRSSPRKVTVVHRRDEFRASKIMLERARAIGEHRVPDARTSSRSSLAGEAARSAHRAAAQRRDRRDARARRSTAPSSRSATSRSPRSSRGQVDVDDEGYVITEGRSTRTNLPGVFAAGDLVDHTYRQAVTAAGSRLPGRARRRVVPARHARGPDARGDARGRPRRGAVGPDAELAADGRQLTHQGPREIAAPVSCLGLVSARSRRPHHLHLEARVRARSRGTRSRAPRPAVVRRRRRARCPCPPPSPRRRGPRRRRGSGA